MNTTIALYIMLSVFYLLYVLFRIISYIFTKTNDSFIEYVFYNDCFILELHSVLFKCFITLQLLAISVIITTWINYYFELGL